MEKYIYKVTNRTGDDTTLAHHGIKGQKWGERRFQNEDGSLTPEGRARYGYSDAEVSSAKDAYASKHKEYSDWYKSKTGTDMATDDEKTFNKNISKLMETDKETLDNHLRQTARAKRLVEKMTRVNVGVALEGNAKKAAQLRVKNVIAEIDASSLNLEDVEKAYSYHEKKFKKH